MARIDGDSQGAHGLAGTMAYRFRIGQVHCQLDRLIDSLGKIDEFQELPVLAPMIEFSAIFDFAPLLFPITDRREFPLRRWAALSKIEQHGLARF